MLLRESLGNVNCRTTMIAHISAAAGSYTETLSTIQIASRVLRMKKKKTKVRNSQGCSGGRRFRSPIPERASTSSPRAPGAGVCGAAHAARRSVGVGELSGRPHPLPPTAAGHPAQTPTREGSACF